MTGGGTINLGHPLMQRAADGDALLAGLFILEHKHNLYLFDEAVCERGESRYFWHCGEVVFRCSSTNCRSIARR